MTEQEFRKLKQLDLIQILLTQGNEVTMQQGDLDRKNERLELLLEENDIIKAKLNDRDAMTEMIKQKLNESDARIEELEEELKKLYADRKIELEETGSLVQAALELNQIFEAAQKEAEQYIVNEEGETGKLMPEEASLVIDHRESEVVSEQQGGETVIEEHCEEETVSKSLSEEETPIEERPKAEMHIEEHAKEETVSKSPSEEGMSGGHQAEKEEEIPERVSAPKSSRKPEHTKSKDLLRFFWKWKK